MQIPLLTEIVKIFGLTIAVLFICHRFRIPTVVGFLISGVLAGPSGFGLVGLSHEVEMLSEIGVVSQYAQPLYAGNRKIFRAFRYF
ncbi:MAG: cation:proton antiporter domain-containing protein, partial [Bacteroidia bacterium]